MNDKIFGCHYRYGVYTITGVPNAHNHKMSYWITKAGYKVAHYCFSATDETEVQYQLRDIAGYIEMFERFLAATGGEQE